jgi:hypothetical protein
MVRRLTALKHAIPTVLLSALAVGYAMPSQASTIVATSGEYNGPFDFDFNPGDYPLAPATIGDFTFAIPTGDVVVGGTISGTFGNADVLPTTAPSDYYIDNGNIEVAECDDSLSFAAACDSTGATPTAWSYTFLSSDLSTLAAELSAGSIDFTVVQNFAIAVQTGTTTLDLDVAPAPVPEPSTMLLFCCGLASMALLPRLRKA